MKKLLILVLLSISTISYSATEDNLKIVEIGAWAQGNSIFYIRFDRNIGPTNCHDDLVKVYLGEEADLENVLKAKSQIRALSITALTANLNVKVATLDTCLHNSPTISQLYIKR
jgi:hypothetical protein